MRNSATPAQQCYRSRSLLRATYSPRNDPKALPQLIPTPLTLSLSFSPLTQHCCRIHLTLNYFLPFAISSINNSINSMWKQCQLLQWQNGNCKWQCDKVLALLVPGKEARENQRGRAIESTISRGGKICAQQPARRRSAS